MAQLTSELERINQKYARADQATRTPRALYNWQNWGNKFKSIMTLFEINLILKDWSSSENMLFWCVMHSIIMMFTEHCSFDFIKILSVQEWSFCMQCILLYTLCRYNLGCTRCVAGLYWCFRDGVCIPPVGGGKEVRERIVKGRTTPSSMLDYNEGIF